MICLIVSKKERLRGNKSEEQDTIILLVWNRNEAFQTVQFKPQGVFLCVLTFLFATISL